MKKLMKRSLLILLALTFSGSVLATAKVIDVAELEASQKHRQATRIIVKVIDRYHYKKAILNNKLSEEVLDRYIETLDPNRFFFMQKDIDTFYRYKHKLDDYLRSAQLEPAFEIFRLYRTRVSERITGALQLLESDFDFKHDEDYFYDREKESWPKDKPGLDEIWRKRVKNDFLSLRLSGKKADAIKKTLSERYQGLQRRIHQFNADDVFQSFINAYTLSLEPHTSFMSPSTSENFDISMRLSLEGIGAVLRTDNEYTLVQEVVSGGPAKLSGELYSGDRIVGVGQGLNGKMEDVIGWRLQDVVEKIRGPKGSVVRLNVLSKKKGLDGRQIVVTIVRNKIKLEDRAAKATVIDKLDGMSGLRVGVIEIPAFYRDFRAESEGDKSFRSTTRDVRELIKELEAKNIDGILIDLRENGGGSLSEATELTGLFIDTGPVVQVKDAFGDVEIERDIDPGLAYAGPLAVLVDRSSASASEIFAGAIQDYGRGLIIGEPTFGKGTVQTLIDLDRFIAGNNANLGRLRLTMAQFFRVNGGSTQHKGVVPDIVFPIANRSAHQGERALENALPWASIQPAKYEHSGLASIADVRVLSLKRIKNDPGFEMLLAEERLIKELTEKTSVTLLESRRQAEWDAREKMTQLRKNRFRASLGLAAIKLGDKDNEDNDEDVKKEDEAIDSILLNEAARILSDYVTGWRKQVTPQTAMAGVQQAASPSK